MFLFIWSIISPQFITITPIDLGFCDITRYCFHKSVEWFYTQIMCRYCFHSDYFIIARTLLFVFFRFYYCVFELALCVFMCRYCFHSDYFIITRTLLFMFFNFNYYVFELALCVDMCRYWFPIMVITFLKTCFRT